MTKGEKINGWTFEETVKSTESLMESEQNMFKWDVLRHLRDFAENYRDELEEYRAIGTPDECREAMEKQTAKKIVRREATDEDIENELREFITKKGMILQCPTCGCYIAVNEMKNCWECGQKLDWSETDG